MGNRYMESLFAPNMYLNSRAYADPSFANTKAVTEVIAETVSTADLSAADRHRLDSLWTSVTEHGATGNGTTNDAAAFAAALATGRPVLVPPPAVAYLIRSPISVPAGGVLKGIGKPQIRYAGTTSGVGIIQSAGVGCVIEGLAIDGGNQRTPVVTWDTAGVKITHDDCSVIDVDVRNARIAGMIFLNCSNAEALRCSAQGGDGPGIRVSGVTYSTFRDNDVSLNLVNFGFYIEQGTAYCTFDGNRALNDGTDNVSLEMLGMTFPCHDNKVINNRAEGTGDNGISITGYNNTVMGNHCRKCRHSGIFIYGRRNTVTGNHCENNNQRALYLSDGGSIFCGITVQPSWGGLGERNTVTGNVCVDTQATPTQYAGIRIGAAAYFAWTAATAIDVSSYRFFGLNIYKALHGGTTSSTGPTHTSGTAVDGTVTWTYVNTAEYNMHGKHNVVAGNTCAGNLTADIWHDAGQANTIITDGDITLPAIGTPNLNIRILVKNASPVVSPGFTANPGSLFLRQGSTTGITAYLKTGINDTDWEAVQTRSSGTTANRPALASIGYDGYTYFDTTLNKPVFRRGSIWVDATGTTV